MKKILSIFICSFCLFTFSFADSKGVKFIKKGKFEKILKKAQKAGKPIFIDVYADWCGPCTMMDEQVFSQDVYADFFNENFICFKMDADDEKYLYQKIDFEVNTLPTFVFLDKDGNLVTKYEGTTTGSRLMNMGKKLL